MVYRIPKVEEHRRPHPTGLAAMVAVVALAVGIWLLAGRDPGTSTGAGPETTDPASGLPYVDLDRLPDEAIGTLRLIDAGGPYPTPGDGRTYRNLEGLLPLEVEGYYSEYAVPLPADSPDGTAAADGTADGASPRRIVVGEGGEEYWTPDGFESLARIRT